MRNAVLGALLGALAATAVLLHIFADYEDALFDQIVAAKVDPGWSASKKLRELTAVAHDLVAPRHALFGKLDSVGLRDKWLVSGDVSLQDGRGDCASYTHVLARLLDRAGIKFRVAQMYCSDSGAWGCHITLEAFADGKWLAADPLYNVVFPASYEEVGKAWAHYKSMVPANYDHKYRYEGVRYTNWAKDPVLMPALRHGLEFISPGSTEKLSLRSYTLNVYRMAEWGVLAALALFAFLLAAAVRRAM